VLKAVEETAKNTNNRINEINDLFNRIIEKVKNEAPKIYSKDLIELLFEHPYSKIEFVVDRLKISRVSASKYLRGLESIGILQTRQVWKETLFINTELFDLLKK
jgi:hypothetical protein